MSFVIAILLALCAGGIISLIENHYWFERLKLQCPKCGLTSSFEKMKKPKGQKCDAYEIKHDTEEPGVSRSSGKYVISR
jgi:hypothetical protein